MNDSIIGSELRKRLRDWVPAGEDEYACRVEFDPAFTGFEGHFPGNPIVPGVCLVELARVMAENAVGRPLTMKEITTCKFRRPVQAGMTADCKLQVRRPDDSVVLIQAEIRVGDSPAGQIRMKAEIGS